MKRCREQDYSTATNHEHEHERVHGVLPLKPFRVLSLFDGCGTARLALEMLQAAQPSTTLKRPIVYAASEICPYAVQVTKTRWPETIFLGDVRHISTASLRATMNSTSIDLLIGGSPCTNLTVAGKLEGLGGEQSKLFWEFVRILELVRPRYFVLENVASMPPEARAAITAALKCEPILIDAAAFGPTVRKRFFYTNIPFLSNSVPLAPDPSCIADILMSEAEIFAGHEFNGVFMDPERVCLHEPHTSHNGTVVVGKVINFNSQKLKLAQAQARLRLQAEGHNPPLMLDIKRARARTNGSFRTPLVTRQLRQSGRAHEERMRIYSPSAKLASVTRSVTCMHVQLADGRVRTLDSREIERVMGFPDNYTRVSIPMKTVAQKTMTRNRRAQLIGLSFHPHIIAWILKHIPSHIL